MKRLLAALAWSALVLAPAAAAPPPSEAVADTYVLGAHDQVEVNFANYPDLKTTTRIAPDNNVVLPLIGVVRIGGMSPAEAATAIAARLVAGGFIKAPSVRVEILDYQSRKASVLGEVNTQGLIVLDRRYSVAEIVARAGGLAPGAAQTAIIVRQKPDGGSERLTVDLAQLISNTGTGALTEVRAGDVVYVPKAATFSAIGAVNKAGTYPLTAGMTVQQALAAAGDIARIGSRAHLRIRRTPAGATKPTTIEAHADDLVMAGDVIIVRERRF